MCIADPCTAVIKYTAKDCLLATDWQVQLTLFMFLAWCKFLVFMIQRTAWKCCPGELLWINSQITGILTLLLIEKSLQFLIAFLTCILFKENGKKCDFFDCLRMVLLQLLFLHNLLEVGKLDSGLASKVQTQRSNSWEVLLYAVFSLTWIQDFSWSLLGNLSKNSSGKIAPGTASPGQVKVKLCNAPVPFWVLKQAVCWTLNS